MSEEDKSIAVNMDANLYAITNINIGIQEENFIFIVFSGNQARQFFLTPKHAKRINLLLTQQIKEYEKQFGELETELPKKPHITDQGKGIGFGIK